MAADQLTAHLRKCPGIGLTADSRLVISQDDLSMRDYLQLRPWNEFNYTDYTDTGTEG